MQGLQYRPVNLGTYNAPIKQSGLPLYNYKLAQTNQDQVSFGCLVCLGAIGQGIEKFTQTLTTQPEQALNKPWVMGEVYRGKLQAMEHKSTKLEILPKNMHQAARLHSRNIKVKNSKAEYLSNEYTQAALIDGLKNTESGDSLVNGLKSRMEDEDSPYLTYGIHHKLNAKDSDKRAMEVQNFLGFITLRPNFDKKKKDQVVITMMREWPGFETPFKEANEDTKDKTSKGILQTKPAHIATAALANVIVTLNKATKNKFQTLLVPVEPYQYDLKRFLTAVNATPLKKLPRMEDFENRPGLSIYELELAPFQGKSLEEVLNEGNVFFWG